jgi:predicted N-acetyltransferase YhbS
LVIRQEQTDDYKLVYDLIVEAFETAEHKDGNEQDLVVALRKSAAFLPSLSLVAEIDGEIAGHILFTKAQVGTREVLVLAPLSVSPKFQGQGVGTALIKEGHRIAKEFGYQYSLVLGSETYYPRMGYLPADQLGIEIPKGIPSLNFMAIKLQKDAKPLCGSVVYAKEFGLQ